MQEQIERESIALTVNASKLTARSLAVMLKKAGAEIAIANRKGQAPHGKQSVKKLMNHNVPTNTIPIEGDKGLFEKIARKWNVDYAFYKTGPEKHLLLFKAGQADAITACFSEYSNSVVKREKEKRRPVIEQLNEAEKSVEKTKAHHKEYMLERKATRE